MEVGAAAEDRGALTTICAEIREQRERARTDSGSGRYQGDTKGGSTAVRITAASIRVMGKQVQIGTERARTDHWSNRRIVDTE